MFSTENWQNHQIFSVSEFCCSPLHAWSACLPCWLGIQRGGTCNNQPMPILVYPGDEALPLSTILTWRVQNWSSILGCRHWHGIPGISYLHIGMSYSWWLTDTNFGKQSEGGKLLGLVPLHTCTQSNTGGQGQVDKYGAIWFSSFNCAFVSSQFQSQVQEVRRGEADLHSLGILALLA